MITLGLALPHYDCSYPEPPEPGLATAGRVAAYAERAEALGFHQVWVSDHFWIDISSRYGGPPGRQYTPECWTMLAALATRTARVRLGTLVLANDLRPPTLLAKMAATLDQLADGRLDLGLGAGWNEPEFTENGYAFPRPGERLARLEEALGVLRALLGGEGGSYEGRFYRAEEALVVPGPVQRPRPPLWVGGRGDKLLGVVARAADGWNLVWSVTPEAYRERLEVLARACAAAGRDPGEVRRSLGLFTLLGRDPDDLAARWVRLVEQAPGGSLDGVELRDWARGKLVGTPQEVLDQLRGWEAAGVEQVVCSFGALPFSVHDDEQLDLAGDLILPALAA
ncbi:MAG TPA: LLM class flavin-dependent oxidoreductase [Actinomycetes bacterium]|nr:LLM class flavin-dependent oxidoreductase [Actinomycetes bacterium]